MNTEQQRQKNDSNNSRATPRQKKHVTPVTRSRVGIRTKTGFYERSRDHIAARHVKEDAEEAHAILHVRISALRHQLAGEGEKCDKGGGGGAGAVKGGR